MIKIDSGGQDSLLYTAICQYKSLTNVTQASAEELYISIVMQLEGYGNETFTAKVNIPRYIFSQLFYLLFQLCKKYIFQDNSNNKVILGISINGIMVAYPNTQTQFYRLIYLHTHMYMYVWLCGYILKTLQHIR